MIMYKGLVIAVSSFILTISCTQPAKKPVTNAGTQTTINRKGSACCVNKVPSRFAIVKKDSVSLKKAN